MGVFDRYTDQAKRAIYFARLEALHRNQQSIGAGDLLIGLTWDEDGRACQIASLKDHALELRVSLGIPHLPSTALPYKRGGNFPLDDHAKKTLAYATREANRSWEYWIDSDHLLRGLLCFQNPASNALHGLGLDLAAMRRSSRSNRGEHPAAPLPKWRMVKSWFREHRVIAVLLAILLLILGYQVVIVGRQLLPWM